MREDRFLDGLLAKGITVDCNESYEKVGLVLVAAMALDPWVFIVSFFLLCLFRVIKQQHDQNQTRMFADTAKYLTKGNRTISLVEINVGDASLIVSDRHELRPMIGPHQIDEKRNRRKNDRTAGVPAAANFDENAEPR
ncbi:MAG: hypothetical protein JNK93_05435 [Planctomycetia bacterium]|nr:hypothetical protein [Planctomycetia bacterium]